MAGFLGPDRRKGIRNHAAFAADYEIGQRHGDALHACNLPAQVANDFAAFLYARSCAAAFLNQKPLGRPSRRANRLRQEFRLCVLASQPDAERRAGVGMAGQRQH